MSAVAVTDHGKVSALVDFYKECKANDIKPILGCELYICDDMANRDSDNRYDHLIVLAKNNIGYKNILKLSSIGFTDGFYYKPRVDFETLKKYKEGIIVTSACLGGTLQKMILNAKKEKDYQNIKDKILDWKESFEDFYLEIQSSNSPEQKKVNKLFAKYSQELDVPLVVTSDVHFLNKEDFESHGVFISVNSKRDNEVYQDCWFKTEEEVVDILCKQIDLDSVLESIRNTHEIADKCNVEIELGISYLPDFPIPEGFDSDQTYFKQLINKGFRERGINKKSKEDIQTYIDRVHYEFEIITKKNYTGYFLILSDFLERCRKVGIYTGDGRGSAGGSLICYLLKITNVDPIFYDLDFSRFLTMERKSLPDIDNDLQTSRRNEAIQILKEVYGYDKVSQICTLGTLQAKSVIDRIGKVLNIPYTITTEIKKYIIDGISLKESLEKNGTLREYQQCYPELFKHAINLEGLVASIGCHAGGVVICPSNMDMSDFTGICLNENKDVMTQVEMGNVEQVGLVKFDMLGLRTLDIIVDALDMALDRSTK